MVNLSSVGGLIYSILGVLFLTARDLAAERYSNYWLLKTDAGAEHAQRVAKENNFRLIRSIGIDGGFYVLKPDHARISRRAASNATVHDLIDEHAKRIKRDVFVEEFQREKVLRRSKRDFIEAPAGFKYSTPKDPMWNDMWYLNRHLSNREIPDMNVTGAWNLGYTGKGVSVTFLDDGLERDPKASDDINGNDSDPMPRYDDSNENKHGTRCAGEVAAVSNNSICSVGVAFNAGVGGIRMLDGDVTDSVEARSLSFNREHIAIYSASWGPDDNGEVVDGPGSTAKQAFSEGVAKGRNGLGSVFVWASGNGGRFNDSCACDGYANSIYTLSISSTSERGEKPWYLEECTSTLATTFSSGDERGGEREIVTTDLRHQCTSRHTGTSAAAPLAAGIIALALEANPKLTWRDVMYLTVLTSRPKAIKSNNYIINKRGFLVSSRYGFGLMDAGRMVELAKNWNTVPSLQSCSTSNSNFKINKAQKSNIIEAVLSTDACANSANEVNFIEQVEVVVTIQTQIRGMLEIYLTSPMGTTSLILPRRIKDMSPDGFKKWSFMSVQLWGEFPRGDWKLLVSSADGSIVQLDEFYLVIHGTKEKPIEYEKLLNMQASNCHYECAHVGYPCGPTEFDCYSCEHYSYEYETGKKKCVSICPRGYFADDSNKSCVICDPSCAECSGGSGKECVACPIGTKLKLDTHECVSNCPEGYFINSNNECEICDNNCLTCRSDSKLCLSCKNSLELILKDAVCVPSKSGQCSGSAYFDLLKNSCESCEKTCAACTSNSNENCLKCAEKSLFLKEGKCLPECGDGYFYSINEERCLACSNKCAACATQQICKTCKANYQLSQNGECELRINNENCDSDCYECTTDKKCLFCKNGLSNFDGKCVSSIPDGYFKLKQKTNRGVAYVVVKCAQGCELCKDLGSCIKCKESFSLYHGQCMPICKPRFYATPEGGCVPCKSPCIECLSESKCSSCESNKKLYDGVCLSNCPLNFYSSETQCLPCHPTCESCTGPERTECLTCDAGFTYSRNECVSKCPDGTFYDKTISECKLCNVNNCSSCIRTPNMCIKCVSPLALDTQTFTCKQCCSRSIHGRVKTTPCCNCPSKFNGQCSTSGASPQDTGSSNVLNEFIKPIQKTSDNLILFVSVLFILASIGLVAFSIHVFRSSCRKNNDYRSVEYQPLNNSNI